jgi:hypothetical protein
MDAAAAVAIIPVVRGEKKMRCAVVTVAECARG